MKPRWRKLGRVYGPADFSRHAKLATHAANPLPVPLEGDVYRVFFSGRDAGNRSSVGAVDIDLTRREIVCRHEAPFFEHGLPGTFYADGVSLGNSYEAGGVRYFLFMGWQSPPGEHWRGDIGRLAMDADGSLRLDGGGPFMGVADADPISLSYPWVTRFPAGEYRMWYGSTRAWDAGNGEMLHVINHATSADGHHWRREGLAVPYELGKAQAFSRPTVVANGKGGLDMWFSYRSGNGERYRIGRALDDGDGTWRLALADAGIGVSESGWDSEMVEYPFVFDHGGARYMLYNGNGHGRTGFGLAIFE